jgi:type I restriction enzyme S subunit
LGIAVPNVNATKLAKIKIPIAPENEQKRIVAEIEKQFSSLDEAVDNLRRVKANLKRYKASVLKAAVEGKLTEEWRKKHPDVEPADKLLERILAERRKKWEEAEWAKMRAKGKVPKDDKWKKKYKEPAKLNLNDLPELQDGWLWVNIDQIMLLLTDYHANGSYKVLKKHVTILDEDAYAIYVRATNLKKNKFDSDLKFVNKKAYDFLTKSKIFGNEIIIGKIGNAGKVYYMPKLDQPCTLGMNLFMLRFNQFLSGKYIYYHLVSFFSEKEIKSKVKGVGNPSIDKNAIRSLRIALPPIKEQDQIVKVVDEQMSLIAHFENELEHHLFRADRLRQSILKKAFSGQLVNQNNNKLAAELLGTVNPEG